MKPQHRYLKLYSKGSCKERGLTQAKGSTWQSKSSERGVLAAPVPENRVGTRDGFGENLNEANGVTYGRGLGVMVKSDFISGVCLLLIELMHLL